MKLNDLKEEQYYEQEEIDEINDENQFPKELKQFERYVCRNVCFLVCSQQFL